MLVHIKEIVTRAQHGGYAIGAFNTQNLETTLAIVQAAVAQKSPVIIQVSESAIKYAGLKAITHIVETIAKNQANGVPVALHLDHGKSFLSVSECVKAGFSSIHIDGSELPFDENVNLTKESVAYAHKRGVWAQGELGTILGAEGLVKIEKRELEIKDCFTDPRQAAEFVKATKVDTFAMSIGNMHGMFKGLERLDLMRLKEIRAKIKLPLVLHGASGVEHAEIRQAIKLGIRIINIDTELRLAFAAALRQKLKSDKKEIDPRKLLAPATAAIQKIAEEKIKVFGSAGKA
jgi:fructose-bisphosphate aldolase class II